MLTGAHSWGSPTREGSTWDHLETPQPHEPFPPTKGRLVGKPGCQVPFISCTLLRQGVPGPPSPIGYSTTASLPNRALSGDVALNIHRVFLKALRSLGSEEQIAKWDPLCKNIQIIATYAQTELGHGEPGLLHVVFRLCTAKLQRVHLHLSSHRFICFEGHMFNMKTFQQMAVKGLEEGMPPSNLHILCELPVGQVIPSGNISSHPLSQTGYRGLCDPHTAHK